MKLVYVKKLLFRHGFAAPPVSLWLGHSRVLTTHCVVIHCTRAASLPDKGRLFITGRRRRQPLPSMITIYSKPVGIDVPYDLKKANGSTKALPYGRDCNSHRRLLILNFLEFFRKISKKFQKIKKIKAKISKNSRFLYRVHI